MSIKSGIFTYSLSAFDIDEDALYYGVEISGDADYSIQGSDLTITPPINFGFFISAIKSINFGIDIDILLHL